jgi:hypothetical protein
LKNQTCGREVTEPKQKLLYSNGLDLVKLEFENGTYQDYKSKAE